MIKFVTAFTLNAVKCRSGGKSRFLLRKKVVDAQMWRNWYTRTVQIRIPQGLEVRVLSSAQDDIWQKVTTEVI